MRKVTIEVPIVEPRDIVRRQTETYIPFDGSHHYRVIVDLADMKRRNLNPAFALAHELGHVVACEFIDGYNKQVLESGDYLSYSSSARIHMGAEKEAWDLAEFMANRKLALKSHKKAMTRITRKSAK